MDDLDTLYVYYVKPLKLRGDVKKLCSEILNLATICWFRIFHEVKRAYSKSEESLEVFHNLIANKCYLPCGVIMCALHLTNVCHFLDLDRVNTDLEDLTQIHSDHIQYLAAKIYGLVYKQTV